MCVSNRAGKASESEGQRERERGRESEREGEGERKRGQRRVATTVRHKSNLGLENVERAKEMVATATKRHQQQPQALFMTADVTVDTLQM